MYCPNGTTYENEFKCPRGTYSSSTGLKSVDECMPCPGGYYCDNVGQTNYTKKCSAGKLREVDILHKCFV